ncbi:MAG: J domain-containing protein [Thaumarchaeota archaeon]|nr:J domain-containing protein [Nitrososphaerota archaeon]
MAYGARNGGSALDDAYSTLGLAYGAPLEQAIRRFRELALVHHPDRGGSNSEFVRIRRAYETIVGHWSSRQGSGAGGRGGPNAWMSFLLDLAVRLIRFIDEQPWSGFWKAVAMALVGVGGAAVVYALSDRSGDPGQ